MAQGLGLVLVGVGGAQREAIQGYLARDRVRQVASELADFGRQLRSEADRVAALADDLCKCI